MTRRPTHPGEVLLEEFLNPLGIAPETFAKRIGVEVDLMESLCWGEATMDADLAQKIGAGLGIAPETWLNLQVAWDQRHEAG